MTALTLLAQHLFAVLVACLVLGLPGWAVARRLDLRLALPVVALPVAWFTLGLALWTGLFAVGLAFSAHWGVVAAAHGAVTVALLAWDAVVVRRVGAPPKPAVGDVAGWTLGGIAACALLAEVLRTRIAFDSLFHLGIARRYVGLDAPTFGSLDRIVGAGVNPAYAVPSWQGFIGVVAQLTGLDAARVLESFALLAVALGACAAAALGRVVSGGAATGEVAGVAAYAWLRVYFPRRELEGDGVAYAALPGNLSLDVLLPLVLVAALLLVVRARSTDGVVWRPAGVRALAGAGAALLVVLHANYVVYLALIGVGTAVWSVGAGLRAADRAVGARGLGDAALSVATPAAAVLLALLPALTSLDQFGAAVEARIDYHLVGSDPWRIVRPGHLYDWFAAPGLLATLLLPFAAWRSRHTAGGALIGGGALALLATALVPPLFALLSAAGSLTLGLRLPRPFGVLLIAAIAIALPALVSLTRDVARRYGGGAGAATSRWRSRVVVAAPLLVVAAASAAYGYPLARREPAQYGWDWPVPLAAVALVCVLVASVVRGRRDRDGLDLRRVRGDRATVSRELPLTVGSVGVAALLVGLCLLPSGVTSLRRGAWQSREVVAAERADDLACLAGVQRRLAQLGDGEVVLADPVTAYGVQALAPVRIVADFKTWNGSTDRSRARQRIDALREAFDRADPATAAAGLDALARRHDARYLVVASGAVEPPLDSDLGAFDARGLRELLPAAQGARRLATGSGRLRRDATDEERAACDLELWQITRPATGPSAPVPATWAEGRP